LSEALFSLVADHGLWIIVTATFLSCLALPIPSSLIMLAGGAFAAAGDLDLASVAGMAWVGAVLGDQTGYLIGRRVGEPLLSRLETRPRRARAIERARQALLKWGAPAVFFTTWLFSPLGPYVNFIAGGARLRYRLFFIWSVLGEAVWVSIYVSLGYIFAGSVERIGAISGDAVGFLAAALIAVLAGLALL
jgi:membrane protein DedA with SNARE-associated domain